MRAFAVPPRSVCVTGGAGFIGSHLVEAFLGTGARVTVIDDLSTGRTENLPEEAELLRADIRSPSALERVREGGFELLVHQAAQIDVRASVADPVADAEVNVAGSLGLLEAARQGGVSRVLFASTGGAIYGEQDRFPADEEHPARPVSPYGVAKLAVEHYLFFYAAVHGLESIALRYANVYGERQNPHGEAGVVAIFLDRLLEGTTPIINGDGLQTRDYVHVSDVVRANLASATVPLNGSSPPFRIYNVGTGREATVVEVFQLLAEALGRPGDAVHGPAKSGEQRRSAVDPGRILAELGLPPPLALEEGLVRTAAWFRRRHLTRSGSGEALRSGSADAPIEETPARPGAEGTEGLASEPRK